MKQRGARQEADISGATVGERTNGNGAKGIFNLDWHRDTRCLDLQILSCTRGEMGMVSLLDQPCRLPA